MVSFLIQQRPILPGRFQPSTFGADGLNFYVRHGYRCIPIAIVTVHKIVSQFSFSVKG